MGSEFEKFDKIMANLKKIEPSASFDTEFKKKLYGIMAKERARVAYSPALAGITASLVFIVAVGFFIYSALPLSPGVIAKTGIVTVQQAGSNVIKDIGDKCSFSVGDIIMAKAGSTADVGIHNKYTIRIKEGSKVRIARLSPRYGRGKAIFDLMEGKVLVSIDEGFRPSKFMINTSNAVSTALGTKFMVEVSPQLQPKTDVSVVQGMVKVESLYKPEKEPEAGQAVVVGAGQKTEVYFDRMPEAPQRLAEKEWEELDELYQIGKKPRVILLVKNRPDRAKQLLQPCPIYISDEKPREIPPMIEEAVIATSEALKTGSAARHQDSIKILERIINEHPSEKYSPQLILYVGAYYEYLQKHKEAIGAFDRLIRQYPNSQYASMAQCAKGIIYEEKIKDVKKANEAYQEVLKKYPNSLEAIWAEERLKGS